MFDNYRIPHVSMLAKFSKVVKETGEYVKPPNAKLSYGTMVFVRANIVMGKNRRFISIPLYSYSSLLYSCLVIESRYVLARAATVAVRYSAIRSQFVDAANPKKLAGTNQTVETPVINYNMVQYRLFPVIAQAYACFFTGREMHRMYNENQDRMAKGDFSYLADLHATSSGLKSLTTTISLAAIEQCRYVLDILLYLHMNFCP
jgi:acyl-CoA oxidase